MYFTESKEFLTIKNFVYLFVKRCKALGLIDRCIKIDTRLATKEELLSKHTAEHVDLLESTENYTDEELERVSSKYDSIYLHPVSNYCTTIHKICMYNIHKSYILCIYETIRENSIFVNKNKRIEYKPPLNEMNTTIERNKLNL